MLTFIDFETIVGSMCPLVIHKTNDDNLLYHSYEIAITRTIVKNQGAENYKSCMVYLYDSKAGVTLCKPEVVGSELQLKRAEKKEEPQNGPARPAGMPQPQLSPLTRISNMFAESEKRAKTDRSRYFAIIRDVDDMIRNNPQFLSLLNRFTDDKEQRGRLSVYIITTLSDNDLPPAYQTIGLVQSYPFADDDQILSILSKSADPVVRANAKRLVSTMRGLTFKQMVNYTPVAMAAARENLKVTKKDYESPQVVDEFVRVMDDFKQGIQKVSYLHMERPKRGLIDIGGNDLFKQKIGTLSKIFRSRDKASEFKIRKTKGLLLTGLPGCLSKTTKLKIRRKQHTKEYTVEEAYHFYHGIEHPDIEVLRTWDKSDVKIESLLPDGMILYQEIENFWFSGNKEVFRLTTESGKQVDVTEEHPFYSPDHPKADKEGFVQLKQLRPGDSVHVKIEKELTGRLPRKFNRREVHLRYHPFAWKQFVNGQRYKRTHFARIVVEAGMNNMSPEELIKICRTDRKRTTTLKFLSNDLDVHHKDGNFLNDSPENLEVLPASAHHEEHRDISIQNLPHARATSEKIAAVQRIGIVATYDITMKGQHKNYVAQDFVVHNTGKSTMSKAIAYEFDIPYVRLSLNQMYGKFLGESETRLKQTLDFANSIGALVEIDEIDKELQPEKETNATEGRVVASLLTYMAGEHDIVFVGTANTIDHLPEALYRKGRFDEIFFFDLPNREERAAIFMIHLKNAGIDAEKFQDEFNQAVDNSVNFVGAEIQWAIEETTRLAFVANLDKEKGKNNIAMFWKTLYTVLSGVVPHAIHKKDAIRKARTDLVTIATPSSSCSKFHKEFAEGLKVRQKNEEI